MNVSDIRKLMEMMATTGTTELEWQSDNEKIRLERKAPTFASAGEFGADPSALLQALGQFQAQSSAAATQPATNVAVEEPAELPGQVVKSPVVGVFYASPSPDSDPFVSVGKAVEAGSPLCIIEAMKLMNEVTSPWEGIVLDIMVENGQRVEYGQPLFRIGGA